MMDLFHYNKPNDGAICRLQKESSLWSHYAISIPSAVNANYLGNNLITGEYFFPRGKKRAPLVILVHGMGKSSVIPCRMMAYTLAKQGIASFILFLVFHDKRIPESIKTKYPNLSPEEWFESYQISVIDIRQVLDWAGSRPEIISEKVSVAGISFGGIISAIAMSLDERVKAGVLIVSGGNSEKITKHSFLLRRQYHLPEDEYIKDQAAYHQYLTEVKEKGYENVVPGKSSYLIDPLTFSHLLNNRPVLMLNALWDEMIPKVATLDLWESFGKPPLKWYPATHASIWMWYPWMGLQISSFLKSALD